MIRLGDAAVLAYTKLRVHRIRTGIAVAVAALLFGLIGGAIIVIQGVFSSITNFSQEGLNNRTLVMAMQPNGGTTFNEYDKRSDAAFISSVEAAHKAIVDKKKAAAKKYSIAYDPAVQDPSPITIDPTTKQKTIADTNLMSQAVQQVVQAKRAAEYKPFDISTFTSKYPSAKAIQHYKGVRPIDGNLSFMKDGKEAIAANEQDRLTQEYNQDVPHMSVLDAAVSKSFIVPGKFDASTGDIPVIIPFSSAEKRLSLKPLDAKASTNERLERLAYVRENVSKATATFCYRNKSSAALLAKAQGQIDEIKANATNKDYAKPKLRYAIPPATECGPVTITSDARSAAEKKQDQNQDLYDKEIGTYLGEPIQKKITARGVGISSDVPNGQVWSLSLMVQALLGSSIGSEWNIPSDLLAQLPADARPDYIFNADQDSAAKSGREQPYDLETYLVEFADKGQARRSLSENEFSEPGSIIAMPFGSNVLFMDEAKQVFAEILKWTLLIIGAIAVIILASIIGRTVSEGRRESAIFRAIGASRSDIGLIYGMYVLFLAVEVVVFSALLAIIAALTVQALYGYEATLGARLAYAASDTTREFYLFDFGSPYLLWIVGVIFAASVVASIIPILLGARRNPIKDMRSE